MKKSLLVLAAVALLASCGGGTANQSSSVVDKTSENASLDASSEQAKDSEDKEDSEDNPLPADALEEFLNSLKAMNYTVEDPGFLTAYFYGDEAVYFDYADERDRDFGYIVYDDETLYSYTYNADGEFTLTGAISDYKGGSLFDYLYSPYVLIGSYEDWSEDDDGNYVTFDEDICAALLELSSADPEYINYLEDGAHLELNDDGTAFLSGTLSNKGSTLDLSVKIFAIGETEDEDVDAYLADPYEFVYVDIYATFAAAVANGNFTVADGDYKTLYAYSHDAFFVDYGTEGEQYGGVDYGCLAYNGVAYDFELVGGEVGELVYSGVVDEDDSLVYEYVYSALDLISEAWEWTGEAGLYSSTDAKLIYAVAALADYESYYYYIGEVYLQIAEDGLSAVVYDDSFGIELEIKDIGTTQSDAIDAYYAAPFVPSKPTDWSDKQKALFVDYLGEEIPFYDGFSAKMNVVDYRSSYDLLAVYDADLSAIDVASYDTVLVGAGYVFDEEQSSINDDTGEITYLYAKDRGDGSQITIQVQFEPVDVLSESAAVQYPNGRFMLIVSVYVPPIILDNLVDINAYLASDYSVFPALPDDANLSDWEGIDYTEYSFFTAWFEVTATATSQDAASSYIDAYIKILENNGFAYVSTWDDYENDNEDFFTYEVTIDEDSGDVEITFDFFLY